MFNRTYDLDDGGLPLAPPDGGALGQADPAQVSAFRLDKYLVTLGRFRQFVAAWNGGAGYTPAQGSGTHTHLNAGKGLSATGGGYEPGWMASDDANVAPSSTNLQCNDLFQTWIDVPGANENLPINCVNWYEAYAFCIWDGGFLPSEAEWEFAAAGGSQQREYPWGWTTPGSDNQLAIYGCFFPTGSGDCTGVVKLAPVGTAQLGAGLWGQLDLGGQVWEWTLDEFAPYVNPCVDCANFGTSPGKVLRGGDFTYEASGMASPYRSFAALPDSRNETIGFRCARSGI
jgi:formylglycine-generating enzyme required for sulfatase activity